MVNFDRKRVWKATSANGQFGVVEVEAYRNSSANLKVCTPQKVQWKSSLRQTAITVVALTMYFWGCVSSVAAQERVTATQEQQTMMETKIAEAAKKTNSMVCDFEQIKKSSLLSEDAVSKGKMFYRTINDTASTVKKVSLRWEYEDGYTFINSNERVQMLSPTGQPLNSVKMNRFFKEIMNTMLMSVNGNGVTDKTKFIATFYMDKNHWYIRLIPIQREIKNMFSVIELVFNARDYMGERVEITEKNGDKTIITLLNKKLNTKIDDSKFLIK